MDERRPLQIASIASFFSTLVFAFRIMFLRSDEVEDDSETNGNQSNKASSS